MGELIFNYWLINIQIANQIAINQLIGYQLITKLHTNSLISY